MPPENGHEKENVENRLETLSPSYFFLSCQCFKKKNLSFCISNRKVTQTSVFSKFLADTGQNYSIIRLGTAKFTFMEKL